MTTETGLRDVGVSRITVDSGNASALSITQTHSMFRSTDGGDHWMQYEPQINGSNISLIPARSARSGTLYGGTTEVADSTFHTSSFNLYRTRDGGETWTGPLFTSVGYYDVTEVLEGHPGGTTIYLVGTNGRDAYGFATPYLYRSDDDGAHWIGALGGGFLPAQYGDTAAVQQAAIDPRDDLTIYAATNSGLYLSTDGAVHWSHIGVDPAQPFPVATSGFGWITSFQIDPSHSDILYASWNNNAASPNFGVYKSINRGTTWFTINQGLPTLSITALVLDRNDLSTLYAGTPANGVWITNDGGQHWTSLGALPTPSSMVVNDVALDPVQGRTIYVDTQA